MPVTAEIDAQIAEMLGRDDWYELPASFYPVLEQILEELYLMGLDKEAARIQALQFGGAPQIKKVPWNLADPRVVELIEDHAAEMVTNVNEGTKYYLRQIIKEGVQEGLGSPELADRISRGLFFLPGKEASKFSQDRILSIVNYEVNRAMSGAGHILRESLGLETKQWFVNNVSPCEICLGNQAAGVVPKAFEYDGVFGPILYPPAHPRTCRCLVMASEQEVLQKLGTQPIIWPLTRPRAQQPSPHP